MTEITATINLLASFVLGGMIGWVREKEGKSAGLRTHILVCVGSALFMLLSSEMTARSGIADPGRIAAGVVAGIGFIGAGCILRAKGTVKGITTAASIWVTAAIGIAAGTGFYVGAIVTTLLALVTLQLLRNVEKKIIKSKDSLE
jgi:putative Mg2+ transporter-C (MgtC) family protein